MKILVVDDDNVSRLVLSGLLGSLPAAEVVQACDGLEAWHMLEKNLRPAVCVSDIRMPSLNGLELMDRARAHPVLSGLPFVMISSASDRDTVAGAVRRGAAGYILKPFNGVDVRTTVARVIREALASRAESPLATRGRLKLAPPDLPRLLTALKAELDGEAEDKAAPAGLARIRTACQTLGLWHAASLVEPLLAPEPAAGDAAIVLREVALLVGEQLAQTEEATA